jgi:hypothetical protein
VRRAPPAWVLGDATQTAPSASRQMPPSKMSPSSAKVRRLVRPGFEYSTGVMEIADEPLCRERQFSPDAKGMCEWGAQPTSASLKIAN